MVLLLNCCHYEIKCAKKSTNINNHNNLLAHSLTVGVEVNEKIFNEPSWLRNKMVPCNDHLKTFDSVV